MAGKTGLYVARDGAGNGTLPQGARLAMGGTLAHNGASPLDVRKGVLVDGGGPVVSGTGTMAYSVRAFVAVTMATTANGPVVLANDSAVPVPTGAAPGSNSRYDVVWVRQHLVAGDGGTDANVTAEIGVTQGSVSATPAVPAIPTGALSLGSALVTAGATSTNALTFTRTHDWTVANGGIIPDGSGGGTFFNGTAWAPVGMPPEDTGWLDCTKVGTWTGACKAKMEAGTVEIRADIAAVSVASGAFYIFANLPAGITPPSSVLGLNARGDCWMGADGGHAYCTPAGGIGVINGTGATRSAISCSITYLVG